ncbi:MAG: DUF3891 family protein [Acidobacteriota bacterium]
MIVAPFRDQFLVITQNDHAHFASELLSLWRSDGLPEHPRRRELLLAAREHDNGWREVDSAPICRRTDGRPHDFRTIPRTVRQEIWRRGTRRNADREPYAALLILRHARHLHRAHSQDAEWQGLFDEWRQLEEQLLEDHGLDATSVDLDYPWIDLTDAVSLTTCNLWRDRITAHGVSAELSIDEDQEVWEGNTLTLDPFPLAGATTMRIAARLIPDRAYSGDVDLATELAIARWQHLSVRVAPPEPN